MKDICAPARKGRKGFTLVELCVVIALLAIVTVMTVSFSLTMERDAKKNQAKSDFMEEVSLIRRGMKDWFTALDVLEEGGSGRPSFKIESTSDTVSVSYVVTGHLVAKNIIFNSATSTFTTNYAHAGSGVNYTFDTVDSIEYAVFNDNGRNKLLKCTVTGSDGFGETFTQTFMISLRFGTFTD